MIEIEDTFVYESADGLHFAYVRMLYLIFSLVLDAVLLQLFFRRID